MVFFNNHVCLVGTSQLCEYDLHFFQRAKKVHSYTHLEWISFPHFGRVGDKPETYPRGMGISYPHSIHLRYTSLNLIPI